MDEQQAKTLRQAAGQRMRQRRADLGLTQAGLAALLECTDGAVQRWEAGEIEPSPRFRPGLARALKLPGMFSSWYYGDPKPIDLVPDAGPVVHDERALQVQAIADELRAEARGMRDGAYDHWADLLDSFARRVEELR